MSPSLEEQWTYFGWQGVCGALIEEEVTLVAVNLLLNLEAIDPVCLFGLAREVLLDMSGPFGSPLGHDDSDVNEIKDARLHHRIRSVVILSALTRQKINPYIYFPFGFFCVFCPHVSVLVTVHIWSILFLFECLYISARFSYWNIICTFYEGMLLPWGKTGPHRSPLLPCENISPTE